MSTLKEKYEKVISKKESLLKSAEPLLN